MGIKALRYLCTLGILGSLYFFLPRLMPGDPLAGLLQDSSYLSRIEVEGLRRLYRLDEPLSLAFLSYWKQVLSFNWGDSILYHQPVKQLVAERLKRTVSFSLPGLLLGALIGSLLGGYAGYKSPLLIEKSMVRFCLVVYSLPPYLLGLLFLYVFTYLWPVFPLPGSPSFKGGSIWLGGGVLPFFCVTLLAASRFFLFSRANTREEREKPYVRFAHSRGLSSWKVLQYHIFPLISVPLITQFALDLGFLLSGSLYLEIVFSIRGMGTLLYDAILSRDYPLIQGILLSLMLFLLSMNLVADLLYRVLDPRTRRRL